ncbi:hypothetical protein DPMN_015418 [Dreissena polymorpha]|uniref:Uncharacterized protein n=1 Tax=Dreissena polymorpha TaxID=45954 RepID=A0A9D4LB15_DREPO|nr:hypothetical protein DPMN_080906 [Dreissena polymorpha]KAH3695462.1 hypothetical protein DPMN_082922 [Dreissena polymorpha]KAH3836255.1 hypothetical protein DPMN_109625 [Dreissena polymorpha]KAH3853736.1 hypothetical protein DPMN_096268 [Dreissena polymorpha]KAH3856694.1 hypothetical protein DPMN_099287 [Dreissena polymorpha]
MSHNWRSYTNKIKHSDSEDTERIEAFSKKESSKTVITQQDSEVINIEHCESESRQSAAAAPFPSNTVADQDRQPIHHEIEITKLTSSPGPSTEI